MRTIEAEAAEEEQRRQKAANTPWWSASLDAAQQIDAPTIPLPPQIRQEQQKHEAARAAAEKAEALRREMAKRDQERRRAAQAAMNAFVACARCGAKCNVAPGASFSFCTECGADLPLQGSYTAAAPGTAPMSRTLPAVPAQGHTAATTGNAAAVASAASAGMVSQAAPRARVSPGAAAALSFFLPGMGQLLNSQSEKGILLLLGLYITTFLLHPPALALLAIRVIVAIDAYRVAERRRAGRPVRSGEWDIS